MAEPALPIAEAGRRLRDGTVTAVALTERALARINERDGAVHAFVAVDAAGARAAARQADAELARGVDRGPMHGVPTALKDIIDAAGSPTTCHSRLRLDGRAAEDSAVAARLRAAGAVLLGKLGTYEFALGGPDSGLPFPPARNPWNLERQTGGSSTGSAAAVAAGYVAMAPGSCTTGSIRGPAAWCGAVGLKPTFGRVSRRGVFPLAWTLDHVGPLARTVEDAAIGLEIMAGHDPADPASAAMPVADYRSGLEEGVAGLRVGVPRRFFEHVPEMSGSARDGIARALRLLEDAGATVADVALPPYDLFQAVGRVIMIAEAFAIHRADLAARLGDYGAVTAKRFAVGAGLSAADYIDALRLRGVLAGAVQAALGTHDLLVTAISLDTAPPFAEGASSGPLLQSSPFNVSGHPAMSVPVGLGRDGLPLAVQIVGRPFDEATVLRAGRVLERRTGWLDVPLPG